MRIKHLLKSSCQILILLFYSLASNAQQNNKREKIESLRVNFIEKKANFSSQEAQVFWPLYNEMNDKLEMYRKNFKQIYNPTTNFNFENDKDAEAYLTADLALKKKEYEITKEYYDKFKKILPIKKLALVRRGEEEFKKEIIKSIKEN